ncbi:site-specific DNA-methyltransferase [Flavobacterium salmonis]|uniref:site-specific DNA-methyltransferase (adenine-specific) n=1 Tax=Flavobacterium salmonis TaxID=2654844 RepID=A0A6V6Z5P4_9FLAO|nr:site-specific DNA-methyltransferase [Flavobacterium salmonis]CAD0006734.1 hypothetical protein FLAT13_03463 [Flavobacterium salmonis]
MDGTSLTTEQEKLNTLRQVLPEAFSEGKLDWEKLKATIGENINFSNERYVLNWAGKSDAFKILQTPTTKTLIPAKDESVDFDKTENLFIEGENLEVLKVLQKSYFGKVKMIYIDPPYNTGNDSFIYPDKFSETKADYEKRVGDKDEDGYMTKDGMFKKNSKENGQYHSNWLNMMMPRLYLAKNLLRQDGVIFVSIDDNEVYNLRLLMNEIFGEENFVASIVWQKKYAATNDSKGFSTTHDYIISFQKSDSFNRNLLPRTDEVNKPYKNDDGDGKGLWRTGDLLVKSFSKTAVFPIVNPNTGEEFYPAEGSSWRANKETMNKWLSENRIYFGKDGKGAPQLKRYLNEVQQGVVPITWWAFDEVGHNDEANKEVSALFGSKTPFDTPKPTRLLTKIFKIGSNINDIILDFFAGSGTTAHAVMALNKEDGGNRKSISVQLPELCEEKSEAYKAGYKTIADISKERIRRAGKKIQEEIIVEIKNIEAVIKKLQGELPTEENKTEVGNLKTKIEQLKGQDLAFKVLKLDDSNFKQWQQIEGKDTQALAEQMKLFIDPISESATIENMVYELLLKSGKDLNSNIEKKDNFYKINGIELALLLEKASQEIIDSVIAEKPVKVIALDKLFKDNDQLKTNTVLQMKDAGIEFKTI